MLIKECMTKKVQTVGPDVSIMDAARLMRDGDLGCIPVEEKEKLVGVVTDRDITVRAVGEGRDLSSTRVRDVMSEGVLYCYDDQSLEEVTQNMGKVQVRRLPVLNRKKRLVGIVSIGDLASRDPSSAGDSLGQISGKAHREFDAREHARQRAAS